MKAYFSTDVEEITEFLKTPALYYLTFGQSTKLEDFILPLDFNYIVVKINNEIAAIFQVKEFTKVVIEAHAFINPKYQNKKSMVLTNTAIELLKSSNNNIKKIITQVPCNCFHVLKYIRKMGFTPCGVIKDGVIYNRVLVTLFLFEKEV